MGSDFGHKVKIASRLEVKKVTVVGLEIIMGALPKIGSRIRTDAQTTACNINLPIRGLAMPAKPWVQKLVAKVFVKRRIDHRCLSSK